MHQPTPSMHRNRHRMGFAKQAAGWRMGCLQEHGMCQLMGKKTISPHRTHNINSLFGGKLGSATQNPPGRSAVHCNAR
eukprot:6443419-Pyramimonas_sp.AAC.1